MIKVIEENDEYWVCYSYLHDYSHEYPRPADGIDLDSDAVEKIADALYEVRIDFRVRKATGEIIYDRVS